MMDSLDEIRLDYLAGHMSDIIIDESMNFYWSQKSSSMYTMGGTAADCLMKEVPTTPIEQLHSP